MHFNFCFFSLIGIPRGITRSTIGLKIYAITVGTKKYKLIIKEKKKKHDKTVLLAKSNSIKFLISKVLIDSVVSHQEYDKIKEEIKYLKT